MSNRLLEDNVSRRQLEGPVGNRLFEVIALVPIGEIFTEQGLFEIRVIDKTSTEMAKTRRQRPTIKPMIPARSRRR